MLTDTEVRQLTGASPGSCGPVGLKIPVYADQALKGYRNFMVGANKDDVHFKNVNFDRDFKVTSFADLRMAFEGLPSPDGKGKLKEYRGIEVGHIFYLGTTYSKDMGAQYLNEQGQPVTIEMGCYGIGVSRTVQAAIEQCYDADGIIWPLSIAPFAVHICLLDPDKKECAEVAEDVYRSLQEKGYDVFLDDRSERPGVKFKDADLLGMPLRLNIGGRGIEAGEVEILNRKTKQMEKVPVGEVKSQLLARLEALKS
jgi:prolyl-tRNA synthetase